MVCRVPRQVTRDTGNQTGERCCNGCGALNRGKSSRGACATLLEIAMPILLNSSGGRLGPNCDELQATRIVCVPIEKISVCFFSCFSLPSPLFRIPAFQSSRSLILRVRWRLLTKSLGDCLCTYAGTPPSVTQCCTAAHLHSSTLKPAKCEPTVDHAPLYTSHGCVFGMNANSVRVPRPGWPSDGDSCDR
jgi:hypothetical protein